MGRDGAASAISATTQPRPRGGLLPVCAAGCGNGFVDEGEECDFGPANDDVTSVSPATCTIARCGDGKVQAGEACDGGSDLPVHARGAALFPARFDAGYHATAVVLPDGAALGFGEPSAIGLAEQAEPTPLPGCRLSWRSRSGTAATAWASTRTARSTRGAGTAADSWASGAGTW